MYELFCIYSGHSALYFYLVSVFLHTVLYFIKKWFIVTNFTLPGYFETPLFRTFFSISLETSKLLVSTVHVIWKLQIILVRRLTEKIVRFLIQAPNFVGIFTFPGWSFPDIVPSLIFRFQLVRSEWNFQIRDPPRRGGLINFPPLKRGGLIEDLR